MRKLAIVVFVFALSMLISVSGFSRAKIRNSAEIEIVPAGQALIAINTQKPFKITIHTAGTEDYFVTPEQGTADVKITNHSTNDLTIKSIKCTTTGFSHLAIADFKPSLPAGRTVMANICVDDSSSLVDIDSLSFEFEAEWDGGKTEIHFTVQVDKDVVVEETQPDVSVEPDASIKLDSTVEPEEE